MSALRRDRGTGLRSDPSIINYPRQVSRAPVLSFKAGHARNVTIAPQNVPCADVAGDEGTFENGNSTKVCGRTGR